MSDFEKQKQTWSSAKKKAYKEAVDAENTRDAYREWTKDFGGYSEKKDAQLKKQMDDAYKKWESL